MFDGTFPRNSLTVHRSSVSTLQNQTVVCHSFTHSHPVYTCTVWLYPCKFTIRLVRNLFRLFFSHFRLSFCRLTLIFQFAQANFAKRKDQMHVKRYFSTLSSFVCIFLSLSFSIGRVSCTTGKMSGEFSYVDAFDDSTFSFDSNCIHKCQMCNILVPYRMLAEHIQSRHKSDTAASGCDDMEMVPTATAKNSVFRHRARPKVVDTDYDTTDTESIVLTNKNPGRRGASAAAVDSTTTTATTSMHSGRTAVRGADRYQAQRLAKLQFARERQAGQNQSNGAGKSQPAPAHPQNRRRIPTAGEMFLPQRVQSELRTQKLNGIFGSSGGGGGGGSDRVNARRFRSSHRAASAQRTQLLPTNFVHCKYCLNIMHKDYVDDHMRRKHEMEPAADNDGVKNDPIIEATVETEKVDDNYVGDSANHSNAHGHQPNGNQLATDETSGEGVNGSAMKKGDIVKRTGQKDFRRCIFCEAYVHGDYLAGHLIRKHRTEYANAGGITWLQYTDDQLNKFIKDGKMYCRNGVIYVKSD